MNWTEFLKTEMEDVYGAANGLVGLVTDEDLGWKPAGGENWMTAGQLLQHLSWACGVCCRGFATGDWTAPGFEDVKPEDYGETGLLPAEKHPAFESVAQARAALAEDRVLAMRTVEEAGEEDLATKLVTAPWNPDLELPLGHRMKHMIDHLVQHKGQLYYYLKLLGRPVNTAHLWGM